MAVKALILAGDGINCEKETAAAAQESGFTTCIQHVNDFLSEKGARLQSSQLFIIPGGFAFGDELGSGKILALKLKHGLRDVFSSYLDQGGLLLGICNGFQVLTRLGVFGKGVSLTQNIQGHFKNQWVRMKIIGNSIFTDPLKKEGSVFLELPIRHGEGRLVFKDEAYGSTLQQKGQCVLQYEQDVNGSWNQIAGLSAYSGRVLGLMPHPEAFWSQEFHPYGNNQNVPLGLELFKNAFKYLKNS